MKVSKILEIVSLAMPPQFRAHWQKRRISDTEHYLTKMSDAQLVPHLTKDPLYRQIIQEILDTYIAADTDREQLRRASDSLSEIYVDVNRATRILAAVYEAGS